MSEPALQPLAEARAARFGPAIERHRSALIGALFQLHDVNRRLTVLDIGSALPETVEFFSGCTCRLHFVDLYRESFVAGQADLSERELQQAFAERLRFPAKTRLDICLLWDFLSYLDDPALRAFNSALKPWLGAGTRAHGFGVHHLAIRLANRCYGVEDNNTLSVRERFREQMRCHPHSQVEMQELFDGFEFERGLLLPDGRLEMLLRSRIGGHNV